MKSANIYAFFLLLNFIALPISFANATDPIQESVKPKRELESLNIWLPGVLPKAESLLQENISPPLPGYKKGFVMAAPWTVPDVQNYKYHWVRDAALVMTTVVTRYREATNPVLKKAAFESLIDYANFSKENQLAPEPGSDEKVGLGEVKFNPDGSRYTKWMRPQNDGPALRAITFIRFARQLITEKKF